MHLFWEFCGSFLGVFFGTFAGISGKKEVPNESEFPSKSPAPHFFCWARMREQLRASNPIYFPASPAVAHDAMFGAVFSLIAVLFQKLADAPFKKLHALETNGQFYTKVMRIPPLLAAKAATLQGTMDNKYEVLPLSHFS